MALDDQIRFVGSVVIVTEGSNKHAIPLNKIRRISRDWQTDMVQVFVEGIKEPLNTFDDFERVAAALDIALTANA